jgi:uncharacterized protein YndB with AHSA1/START domain
VSVETTPVAKKRSLLRIVKVIAIALACLIVVLLGVVAMQPDDFKVVRSATIAAPASKVFAMANDFHKWEDWSPWAKLDPEAKNTFEGPDSGKGAMFSWDGNDKVGAGKMTILESRPDELIRINLEFFRPMQDSSITEFAFKPEGAKTQITWSMSGHHTFVSKGICMFMNMDKVIGESFEKGLSKMRELAE